MLSFFISSLVCAKTLDQVKTESYTNQFISRKTIRVGDATIANSIWIDFPGSNRSIWYDDINGNFKFEKSILIRTSGLFANGSTISVKYSCGFECEGAENPYRDGRFCWLVHMSQTGTFHFENVHLRACGKIKDAYWATIYAKGDGNYQSRVFNYYSTNLTDCYVNARGCLGYFQFGKDFSGTYLNFVNCGQNKEEGAFFCYKFNGNFEISNINFVNVDAGTDDMIKFEDSCSIKTASNLFFKNCHWGLVLFRGGSKSFALKNIYLRNCVSTNYGGYSVSIITSDNNMGYPSTNIIDCIYVDRVWSIGYLITPSNKFSATFRFSQSNGYFQSNEDSQKGSSISVGAILAFIFGILSGLLVSFLICLFIINKFYFQKKKEMQVFPSVGTMTKESSVKGN